MVADNATVDKLERESLAFVAFAAPPEAIQLIV
jgi:hypothetical protein